MDKRRAFTLIEIVVALAIIFVLSAMLLGVLGRVRENARKATCQSNLHQIYLSLVQYVADNDSHFPNGFDWKAGVTPYIKESNVFTCPDAPRPIPVDPMIAHVDDGSDYGVATGWINTVGFIPSSTGLPIPRFVGVNEAMLEVSKILVAGDTVYTGYSREVPLPHGAACGLTDLFGAPTLSSHTSTVHNGGANDLFYDGHVQWMTPEQDAEMKCESGRYMQPPFRAGGPHIPFPRHPR